MRRRVAVLLPGLVVLAGCGAGSVAADDVAAAVAEQVEGQAGARPDVDCPEDLPAEVGATARCTLTLEGVEGEYGVTATVTKVEDDQAFFDIQVDQEPLG
ncbi:DUF4333 domain-containing protein [Blastococcus sp. SYSU D00669]